MEADARAHPDDEVAEDEGDHLHGVNGVRAKPEDAGHGAGERKADQEGIVDPLLESRTAGKDAAGLNDGDGLAGTGDCQLRTLHLSRVSPRTVSRAIWISLLKLRCKSQPR